MKTYCLIFKPLSVISRIPDAQTIFGAVCNILIHTQQEEIFNNYINSLKGDKPLFVHSSMFPIGQMPMVNQNLFSTEYINQHVLGQSADKQLTYLQEMKKFKKIQWMSEGVYRKYISNNKIESLRNDLLSGDLVTDKNFLRQKTETYNGKMQLQLNTHVQKSQLTVDKENDLYYDSAIYCDKNTRFCVYVKSDLEKNQLFDIFKYSHIFGFGERHSVGKNSFKLEEIIENNLPSGSGYQLLLSKSVVDQDFCLTDSFYSIESRVHRTSKYYLNHRIVGRFNLLSEGSYMKVLKKKEWYGHLLDQEYDGQHLYFYAIGFTL